MSPIPACKVLTLSILLILSADGAALGARDAGRQVGSALKLHEAASTKEEQIKALEAMGAVSDRHPDHWLASFWTAYLHTQAARLLKMDETGEMAPGAPMRHLEEAREALRRCRALRPEVSGEEAAAVHSLRSLILKFEGWLGGGAGDQALRREAREALNEAIRAAPESPVVLTMIGTDLIAQGQRGDELGPVLAGRRLLLEAQAKFGEREGDRAETTHFNSEWVGFWLARTAGLLAEKGS